jgi:hypothetical protein
VPFSFGRSKRPLKRPGAELPAAAMRLEMEIAELVCVVRARLLEDVACRGELLTPVVEENIRGA